MTSEFDSPSPVDDSEIFALGSYEFPELSTREFKPWHKPRKQYVRRAQWGAEIERLLALRPGDERTLSYLGLPGSDLLDLRYILDRFDISPGGFQFLGFDVSALPQSPDGASLNVALTEVRSDERVDSRSDIIGDDISLVGEENSLAFERARVLGPFDVINLDLCGGFAQDPAGVDRSLYSTVQRLMNIQFRNPRPWVFLLTTRVGPNAFESAVLAELRRLIESNIRSSSLFAQVLAENIGNPTEQTWRPESPFTPAALREFSGLATVGLAKWFLNCAQRIRCEFSVAPTLEYTVYGGSPTADMVSIAFRFDPVAPDPDPSGLAAGGALLPSEISQAIDIPEIVARVVDVDALLASNSALAGELIEESAELLVLARYDRDSYMAWARRTLEVS